MITRFRRRTKCSRKRQIQWRGADDSGRSRVRFSSGDGIGVLQGVDSSCLKRIAVLSVLIFTEHPFNFCRSLTAESYTILLNYEVSRLVLKQNQGAEALLSGCICHIYIMHSCPDGCFEYLSVGILMESVSSIISA